MSHVVCILYRWYSCPASRQLPPFRIWKRIAVFLWSISATLRVRLQNHLGDDNGCYTRKNLGIIHIYSVFYFLYCTLHRISGLHFDFETLLNIAKSWMCKSLWIDSFLKAPTLSSCRGNIRSIVPSTPSSTCYSFTNGSPRMCRNFQWCRMVWRQLEENSTRAIWSQLKQCCKANSWYLNWILAFGWLIRWW